MINDNSSGKASLTSTLVSASGKTCSATVGKQSCSVRGILKNATVNISAKSKNAGGFGLPSSTVRYKVGSSSWTVASQAPATTTKVALRPYSEFVPSSYSSKSPVPLVVLLHGYGSSGKQQETYMNFTAVAEQRGFILTYPDGIVDATGKQFWNATEVCCNFFSDVDDEHEAVRMAAELFKLGIYVVAFSYPVVPMGKARIRVQVCATHTKADIDTCVAAFVSARES